MESSNKDLINWIKSSEQDRRESQQRPVAFVNFQSHVIITTEHVLVFEPEGISMDDPSLEWVVVESDIDSQTIEFHSKLDLSEIIVDAIPLGFNHTDLVISWDHEFRPHCLLLSRENYNYFYVADPKNPELVTFARKCTSVETQPHIAMKSPDGFQIEIRPTKNFFNLSSQIGNSFPEFLEQELSESQMDKVSSIIKDFDLILARELD